MEKKLIFVREYSVENFKQMVKASKVRVLPQVKRDSQGNVVLDAAGKPTFCDIKEGKFFFSYGIPMNSNEWIRDEKGNVKDRVGKVSSGIDFTKEVVVSLCIDPQVPDNPFFMMHNKSQDKNTIIEF